MCMMYCIGSGICMCLCIGVVMILLSIRAGACLGVFIGLVPPSERVEISDSFSGKIGGLNWIFL